MAHLQRLVHVLGANIRHASIPCPVAVDGSTIILRDISDRSALARGLACLTLTRGGRDFSLTDVRQLARCLESFGVLDT